VILRQSGLQTLRSSASDSAAVAAVAAAPGVRVDSIPGVFTISLSLFFAFCHAVILREGCDSAVMSWWGGVAPSSTTVAPPPTTSGVTLSLSILAGSLPVSLMWWMILLE
ncbi:hypothetical protein PFISCL1PPCAC_21376, partial [Pristionchus fissidentatus]